MGNITEEWRDVVGYEGRLQVSSLGRVRSKQRLVHFSDNKPPREYPSRILIANIDRLGYPRLRLRRGKEKVSIRVHRLVATAFIDNPGDKPQVNHINGDKTDNRVCNLEWATNRENQLHANSTGLRSTRIGEASCRFKGQIRVYDNLGNHVDTLHGNADMASKGFDFRLVSACINGKRKSHKGCTFERIGVAHETQSD